MICKPCRLGGNFTAALDYSPPTGSDLGNVLELHEKCKGDTWCNCQHSTTSVIRRKSA